METKINFGESLNEILTVYFYNLEHGSEPLLSTLVELSNIFDCSIDYLIGRE